MSNKFETVWNDILENFDWVKVHKTMEALGWKYWGTDDDLPCPSIGTLVKTARSVCEGVWNEHEKWGEYGFGSSYACGGFEAELKEDDVCGPYIILQFVVAGWAGVSE